MTAEGKRYNPFLFYALAVLAAFAAGFLLFQFVILPLVVGKGELAIVPELKGVPVDAAEEACAERGLRLMVAGERYSSDIPAGYVLEQDPASGEGLKGRRTVRVITSSGVRMETVPDVVGGSVREAELSLEDGGLRRGRSARIFAPADGPDAVIATSPPRGADIPAGSPVDLLIMMTGEPRVFLMPDLVGKDIHFVRERLERGGFHITRVVTRRDGDEFPGTILSQNPPPGYSIKEGGTIELVVSTVD